MVQERSDENAQEEKYQGTAKTSFEEKEIKEEHLKEKESKEEDLEEMRKSFEIGGNTLIILFCLILYIISFTLILSKNGLNLKIL